MQKKRIWFCLRLDKMQYIYIYIYIYIYLAEFRSIKLLPTKERVQQCINTITFKFFNKSSPFYLNEISEFALHSRKDTRNNFAKLKYGGLDVL